MIGILRNISRISLAGLLMGGFLSDVEGQLDTVPSRRQPTRAGTRANPASKTTVSVEILTGKEGVGLQVQKWRPIFERLGVSIRVRRAILDDKPEVKEQKRGPLRQVRVIGRIDRSGRLIFPDRTFTPQQAANLVEWLRQLKIYGAQGAPQGQPLWGLSKSQFGSLYAALSQQLVQDLQGLTLNAALESIPLSEEFPLRLTPQAHSWLRKNFHGNPKVRHHLNGTSHGTALAILLSDFGLGFHPLRTPEGSIELAVDPIEKFSEVWPIGWKLKLSRRNTAPKMFQLIPVELDDIQLVDVLDAVSLKTGVPIHINHYRIEKKGIDVGSLRVSHPPRKTSWSLLLRGITNPHKMTRRFRIDERGRPFVWITTLEPGRPGR